MKIRTDFVTNSSSSSFTVWVTIEDKNGETYQFWKNTSGDQENSDNNFHGHLDTMMKDARVISEVSECLEDLLSIEETGIDKVKLVKTEEAADAIENVSKGDEVELIPREERTGPYSSKTHLDVVHQGNKIGEFPDNKGGHLPSWIDRFASGKKKVGKYEATVISVSPLSRQKKPTVPVVNVSVKLMLNEIEKPEKVLDFENVKKLCNYLLDNVWDSYNPRPEKKDKSFVKSACDGMSSVNDVSKIIIKRKWEAWGEYATLFADCDDDLCELAQKVVKAKNNPKQKQKALKNMRDYINTNDEEPITDGESSFGRNCTFHYAFNGDDTELEKVAHRLCFHSAINGVSGYEHHELNAVTGEVKEDAYFDLK